MKCSCRPRDQCENCFAAQVREYAELQGWLVYQSPTWRRTAATAGFPDMVLVREGQLIFAELKRNGGHMSEPQRQWQFALLDARSQTYVWRPFNWPEIEDRLRRPPAAKRLPPRPYEDTPPGVQG